ncbi:MAG: ANTAR domain-containing protein [Clostridia bacterium]
MDCVLLVCAPCARDALEEAVRAAGAASCVHAQGDAQARPLLLARAYDVIILDASLGDAFAEQFALDAAQQTAAGVLLLWEDLSPAVQARAIEAGVMLLQKPVSAPWLVRAVQLGAAVRNRLERLQRQNLQLQRKMADIQWITRAKCVLMQYLGMTEAQAHRYLEKQAMDRQISKRAVAEGVLRAYEP